MAVSEDTLPQRRVNHVPRPGVKFVAFVVSTVVGLALAAGAVFAYHESIVGRILPGVSVAGVDVGGLTPSEARALLVERLRVYTEGGLRVRSNIGSTTIAFGDVGRAADVDAMLAEAFARGQGGTWLDETVAGIRTRMNPESVGLRLLYDPDRAAAAVAAFADRMELDSIDASITRTVAGFRITPSVGGSRLDETAALAAVHAAMRDPATSAGALVDAPAIRVEPAITTESADRARIAAGAMEADLKLVNGKLDWTITAKRIWTWISFQPTPDGYQAALNQAAIEKYLGPIAKKVARPVLNAAFLRDRQGRIVGSKAEHAGRALDVKATTDRITAALNDRTTGGQPPAEVALKMVAVAPKVTAAEVAKTAPLMVQIGGWSTYYQVSAHNGFGANISVPTRRLNGTVVQPGQTFDFWGGLGEVSFRTGYRLGGAIVGGHTVEGRALAGGICAASTTLFNAALRGGLQIVSRQPHWYYITRYPLGLDATVSGSQSMRFRNDTKYPILIRGFTSPGHVRFELWSVPNGRTVNISRPSVSNVVKGYDTVVKTTAIPAGTRLRTEWPVDGKDVVVTRTVRDSSGRIIHHETYVSHYHRMVGITQVGIRSGARYDERRAPVAQCKYRDQNDAEQDGWHG